MISCSATIKRCGLKGTRQVANLNGVTDRTIQLAYNSDRAKFKGFVMRAIQANNDAATRQAKQVLDSLQNNC